MAKWARAAEAMALSATVSSLCISTVRPAPAVRRRLSLTPRQADRLFFHRKGLEAEAGAAHPVGAAVDALTDGMACRVPHCVAGAAPAAEGAERETVAWLEKRISHQLIDTKLPPSIAAVRVERGRLWITAEGLYEVSVTLTGAEGGAVWRLLSLDVLVRDAGERVVTKDQIPAIHGIVARRLSSPALPEPLLAALSCLHSLCVSIRLTVMAAEAERLARGAWRGALKVRSELGSSLRLEFWDEEHELVFEVGGAVAVRSRPEVIDPGTGAAWVPQLAGTDLAGLLTTAIQLHSTARLTAARAELAAAGLLPTPVPWLALEDAAATEGLGIAVMLPEMGPVSGAPWLPTAAAAELRVLPATGKLTFTAPSGADSQWARLLRLLDASTVAQGVRAIAAAVALRRLAREAIPLGLNAIPGAAVAAVGDGTDGAPPSLMLHFREHSDCRLAVTVQPDLQVCFALAHGTSAHTRPLTAGMSLAAAVQWCLREIPGLSLAAQLRSTKLLHTRTGPGTTAIHRLPGPVGAERLANLVSQCTVESTQPGCCVRVCFSREFPGTVAAAAANVAYDATEHCSIFTYPEVHQGVKQFMTDWECSCRLFEMLMRACDEVLSSQVAREVGAAKQQPDVHGLLAAAGMPDIRCRFEFASLVFEYPGLRGADEPTLWLRVRWAEPLFRFSVELGSSSGERSPQALIESHLGHELLQHGRLVRTLGDLLASASPLTIMSRYPRFESDFAFVPRSSTSGRLWFYRAFALDLTFLPGRKVAVIDAATPLFGAPASMPRKVPGLAQLLGSQDGQLSFERFSALLTAAKGGGPCPLAAHFVGQLLLNVASQRLGKLQGQAVRWTDAAGAACCFAADPEAAGALRLTATPPEPAWVPVVRRFIAERVQLSAAYSITAFKTMLAIMTGGGAVMDGFLPLLEADLATDRVEAGGIRLLLVVPPGLPQDRAAAVQVAQGAVLFIVRFADGVSQQLRDVPLRFDLGAARFSLGWSDSGDATPALDRLLADGAPFGTAVVEWARQGGAA